VKFTLTRILPSGETRQHSPVGTLRIVETAAAYVLMDNTRVPRGDARTFAATLVRRPLGTEVLHPASGYAFRVDRV
jgi:hypothetical protein